MLAALICTGFYFFLSLTTAPSLPFPLRLLLSDSLEDTLALDSLLCDSRCLIGPVFWYDLFKSMLE